MVIGFGFWFAVIGWIGEIHLLTRAPIRGGAGCRWLHLHEVEGVDHFFDGFVAEAALGFGEDEVWITRARLDVKP